MIQAWDVLRRPELIPEGSSVTVVGGGMVGIETAECIAKRARQVTILEGQNVVAKEMARNNRWDVLLRLRGAKARIVTGAPVMSIEGDEIVCRSGQDVTRHPAGDRIVLSARGRCATFRGWPTRPVCHGSRWATATTFPAISSPRSAMHPWSRGRRKKNSRRGRARCVS
jgi:glycine/D-amino acid oxidase-like deaminating enzyme